MQVKETKRKFSYTCFVAIMVFYFIPSIAEAVKVWFVNTSHVSISVVSQIEWFDLVNEAMVATLTIPMYSILNRSLSDLNTFKKDVFKYLILIVSIYFMFSAIVYSNAGRMLANMVNSTHLEIHAMETYLKLETIAFSLGIVFSFLFIVFVVLEKSRYIYCFVVARVFCLILSNAILIPKYGSFGVAYSNIVTNIVLGAGAFYILVKKGYIDIDIKDVFLNKKSLLEWFRVGFFQGLAIIISNLVYGLIVVKMISSADGLENYWIANNFIWGWLLVPSFALGEVVKSELKDGYENMNTSEHKKIILITIIVWVLSMPLWKPLFRNLMGVHNATSVFNIVIKLLPFYAVFLVSNYLESIFQAIGKTNYICCSSLFVNIIYYGSLYLLVKGGYIRESLNFTILLFGFGIVFTCIILWLIKKILLDRSSLQHEEK